MAKLEYLDFDLSIEGGQGEYQSRVLDSPAGQAACEFAQPFTELELENFYLRVGRPRQGVRRLGSPEMQAAQQLGARLFEAAFGDEVYACLRASLNEAQAQEKGLRLRLHVGAAGLSALPWEYLYNPRLERFLSLSVETPIVRYLDLPQRPRPLAVQPPLKVLAMISSPVDFPPLDVGREWRLLQEALAGLQGRGLLSLERLERADLGALQRRLRQGDVHIFHYVGHGKFDEAARDGLLLFEDEQGRGRPLSGNYLGTILHNHRPLRLAVLNACEGARASASDPFSGVAQGLVRQGVPAVVAMQFEITDRAAITLAREFYGALADGYPLDAALVEARAAIFAQGNDIEWGTPVYFTRAPDGRIFEVAAAPAAQPAGLRLYYPTATPAPGGETPRPSPAARKRIFISYKRGAQPDEALALRLYAELGNDQQVFIDQQMPVGSAWRERIQAELETCDFLIPLLSDASVHSEMVEYEISLAHQLGRAQGGRPAILPVRVAFTRPFDYPLNAYLNHLNWALWNSEADSERLLAELRAALAGGELGLAQISAKAAALQPAALEEIPRPRAFADPLRLERPDGTMDPESRFYIERPGDAILRRELERQGVTVVIKAARQMGKSSLLARGIDMAARRDKAVAFLDFQLLDEASMTDPQAFFKGFCHWLADELELEDTVEDTWKAGLGNVQLCTKYVRRNILAALSRPLALAMDEVDRMLGCEFRSDFFGMLRNWHNSRRAGQAWDGLDLLLVISTEPYLLIDDLKQSPFNVGEVIRLEDFDPAQVADLNQRHGAPFSAAQLERLMALLGGHPYLTRQALYRVACAECSAEQLLARAADERGPFGDHLRRHLARFAGRPELRRAMRQVIQGGPAPDEILLNRLQGAGLVVRREGAVAPRCGLYADYFRTRLED